MMIRDSWLLGLIVCLLLLSGCGSETVVSELDQRQATEIVALLNASGIVAKAVQQVGQGQYNIEVRSKSYADAVNLLHRHGLPREHRISLRELVNQQGLMPPSREIEALRLDLATALELENLLANDARIVSARVIVRVSSIRSGQNPGVTVMLQTVRSGTITASEVRRLVAQVIPGISAEQILVITQPVVQSISTDYLTGVYNQGGVVKRLPLVSFLGYWHVPDSQYDSLALALAALLLLAVLMGFGLGYGFAFFQQAGAHLVRRIRPSQLTSVVKKGGED